MNIKSKIKYFVKNTNAGYPIHRLAFLLRYQLPIWLCGEKYILSKTFHRRLGFKPNFENPKYLAEKLQWVKLHSRYDFQTLLADKYRNKKYFADNFGEEYVVPLYRKFDTWNEINIDDLPEEPFIIKANTGSGTWEIIRDKSTVDIDLLRAKCRRWMNFNHYYTSLEWQYKNIQPCIIIEKLLTDSNGCIPTDYKLHYFGGQLQFIYCVCDREGDGYRAMFTPDWKLLPFQWASVKKHQPLRTNVREPQPKNLEKMIEFGNRIAKDFPYYVRVDYYELEGKFYFSEITMCHGSGMNLFFPPEAELPYAEKIVIPNTKES